MSKAKRANELNSIPCWKVRIYLKGAGILHVLSKNEPIIKRENGRIKNANIEYITDTEHGDTVGFIDWNEVSAVTWRYAPLATA